MSLDIADDTLVVRHRRPITEPYPNPWSHPLPNFNYDRATGCIHVTFNADPAVTNWPQNETNWKDKIFLLSTLPPGPQSVVAINKYLRWAPKGKTAQELAWDSDSPIEPENAILTVPMENGGENDRRMQWDVVQSRA